MPDPSSRTEPHRQITNRHVSLLAKLLVAGISLVVGVIAIEVLVRATHQDSPLVWRPDPVLGWWHIPGATIHWTSEGDGWVQVNDLGLRDRNRTRDKPPGVFRIAVFGDSMTEATGVNLDETFCQLLEARLTRRAGRPVEVLNFGVNGYSPLQEYLLYREVGRAFVPDLVLHALFLDNDVADLHAGLASGQRGAPFLRNTPGPALDIDYSAAEESARSYARQPIAFIRSTSAVYRMVSAFRSSRRDAAAFASGKAASGGIPRRYLLYAQDAPETWGVAWTRLQKVISAFATEAGRNGSRYVLLSVPAGQIVNEEAWNSLSTEFPEFASHRWNRFGPEARLASIAKELEIPIIAPLRSFMQASNRDDLFFGRVGHFRTQGHEALAGILEQELSALKVVPETALR